MIKKKILNLLNWAQGYLKTDILYIVKGGFWLFLGQVITFGTSFVLTWAFANFATKEVFGAYKYILSITAILAVPVLSGMNTALLRAVAAGKEGVLIPILKTKLKWGLLSVLGSFGLAIYYFLQGNKELALGLAIAALFIPLVNSFCLWEQFLAGKKAFKRQNIYKAIINMANMVALMLAILLKGNLFVILATYFISWALLHSLFFVLTYKKYKPAQEYDAKTMRFGKHLSLMGIIGMVDSQLDKIVLWHFLGADQVAIFSIALVLPATLGGVLKIINGLAMPKLSQAKISDLKRTIPRKTFYLFILVLPIAVGYILFAPLLFKIFFPKYIEAVIYTQVAALTLLFFPRALFGTALTAKAQTKALYANTIILSPLYIIALLLLVPAFGIMGAMLASLALEIGTFILQAIYFRKMK
ncbi:oligosaccharide flippase family protein [Candidatus Parcubacteria bacterium]|nr:oligosaccharide flippase family protein [Candidatus Parcubacteria bacterium]